MEITTGGKKKGVGKVIAGTRRFNLIDFNHVPIPISQIYARIIKASHLIAFFV